VLEDGINKVIVSTFSGTALPSIVRLGGSSDAGFRVRADTAVTRPDGLLAGRLVALRRAVAVVGLGPIGVPEVAVARKLVQPVGKRGKSQRATNKRR
jgi:hypothetical protein